MQILIALELDDDTVAAAYGDHLGTPYADDDLVAAFSARLEEVYLGPGNEPVAAKVLALGDFTDILPVTLDALEVGADGVPDEDEGHLLGSIQTMRQMLGVG